VTILHTKEHQAAAGRARSKLLTKEELLSLARAGGRAQGPVQGRKMAESGELTRIGKLPQTKAARKKNGRKAVESGQLARARELPHAKIAKQENGRRVGLRKAASGELARMRKVLLSKKPTNPEAIFYGLVFGNPMTAKGFTAQQDDGIGIYDGAWLKHNIIVEYDGGGHAVFHPKETLLRDISKDERRTSSGRRVLRETDESVLFLKALSILEDAQ